MMNKRHFLVALPLCFSLSVQAAPVTAKPTEQSIEKTASLTTAAGIKHDEQAAKALAEALQAINTLSAHFEQQSLGSRGRVKTESGEMLIKRPDHFRWDTHKPFSQKIISTDNKIWVVDTDLMQVIIKKQDDSMGTTPVQLLSGDAARFLKDYRVVRVGSHDELVYTLRPRSASELFEQLDVTFVRGQLKAMIMSDSLGGKRQIRFSDVTLNRLVDDSHFKVSIPEDYDVIDETRS